jgi:hypothetical protein
MTRGRCGSLLLHRDGLAPSTPCRSPGALRFTPVSDRIADIAGGPFRAKCGQSAAQENTSLFDQLVRDAEQTRGDGQPERLGSLHVNGQLEFGRLQNRQIGRFSAH